MGQVGRSHQGRRRDPAIAAHNFVKIKAFICSVAADIVRGANYIKPAPGPSRVFGVGDGMTGSTISSDGLDLRRRRLLFRSWHRGTREADLIMGRFADAHVVAFSDAELDQFEHLLDALETDLLSWMTGISEVPADHDTPMFRRVREFHFKAVANG
jgi:antitoxin CptB